jgi:CxxC-x17-CxxC domain-containing protein
MGRFKTNNFGKRGFGKPNAGGRQERGFGRPRTSDFELTSVICARCGRSCEVPFKPTTDKPVYCRSCFKQTGVSDFGGKPSGFSSKDRSDFRAEPKTRQSSEELDKINQKLDKIMRALKIN